MIATPELVARSILRCAGPDADTQAAVDFATDAIAALVAEAVAKLTAENEALRDALRLNLFFAREVAEQLDVDTEDTVLVIRVMPEGREVGMKSWSQVIEQGDAAIRSGE